MAPIFRADQVGSLIRPASLLKERYQAGIYSDELSEQLATATKDAIAGAVQKQLDLSIRPITSGEYERTIFYSGFFEKLEGMKAANVPVPEGLRTGLPTLELLEKSGQTIFDVVLTTGKIRHVQSGYLDSWKMLRSCLPEERWKECKIAIPSVTWHHMQMANGTAYKPDVYANDREYLGDLAAAYQTELRILYDAGLRSVQIDDPNLTHFVMDSFIEGLKTDGVDAAELMDLYVWAHNESIKGLPADMHLGVHLCRGNFGPIQAQAGGYEKVAEKLFNGLNYNTFYLEFDTFRSGSFEPLRFLPKGKNVCLGLVSTKTAELEDMDTLVGRVHEAAAAIAGGQGRTLEEVLQDTLSVSPQCGFSSHSFGKGAGMSEEKMWDKLTLVRDLSRKVWKDAQ